MISIPSIDPNGKDLLRAYSVGSGEQQPEQLRLLIKYREGGVASKYFWDLHLGQSIPFTGPFGKLFFPAEPGAQLYFLSTGSGLAPHLSYLESYIEKYPQSRFEFLIGVRTPQEFFLQDYLEEKRNRYSNLHYQFVLSRPDTSWKGRRGYLQQQLESLPWQAEQSHFFVCGNESMAKATKEWLLEHGLPKERLLVEIY
jgi:ferredoxin-NADP reductase